MAETSGLWAIRLLRDRMLADPEGRKILEERPRVTVSSPFMPPIRLLEPSPHFFSLPRLLPVPPSLPAGFLLIPSSLSITSHHLTHYSVIKSSSYPLLTPPPITSHPLRHHLLLSDPPIFPPRTPLWRTAGTFPAQPLEGPTLGSWQTGTSTQTTDRQSGKTGTLLHAPPRSTLTSTHPPPCSPPHTHLHTYSSSTHFHTLITRSPTHTALHTPSSSPPLRFVDDEELAYVLTRMREVHDFWHVLFGCHTNVFGELALKGLEFVQVGRKGRGRGGGE